MSDLTDTALQTAAARVVALDGVLMQLTAEREKLIATVERLEELRRRLHEIDAVIFSLPLAGPRREELRGHLHEIDAATVEQILRK